MLNACIFLGGGGVKEAEQKYRLSKKAHLGHSQPEVCLIRRLCTSSNS